MQSLSIKSLKLMCMEKISQTKKDQPEKMFSLHMLPIELLEELFLELQINTSVEVKKLSGHEIKTTFSPQSLKEKCIRVIAETRIHDPKIRFSELNLPCELIDAIYHLIIFNKNEIFISHYDTDKLEMIKLTVPHKIKNLSLIRHLAKFLELDKKKIKLYFPIQKECMYYFDSRSLCESISIRTGEFTIANLTLELFGNSMRRDDF
ncbi:MAG: hypothetical protein Tsb0021_02980 [Chlamydiales bacterium]